MATTRLLEFTGLTLMIAMVLAVGPSLGRMLALNVGAELQEAFFPVLAPMRAVVDDPIGKRSIVKLLPSFQITSQHWQGTDLLLVEGTLCKAQDYEFVDAKVAYGDPQEVFQPAQIEFLTKAGSRVPGCQTWRNWLLVGAKMTSTNKWFMVLTHRPKHGLWEVRQRIGPFDFPARSSG
jgi:hypothetical protein